jgi:hypothetical protein
MQYQLCAVKLLRQDHGVNDVNDAVSALDVSGRDVGVINGHFAVLDLEPTHGPTITFVQPGPKSPIKFKRQWIDDFIREHTCDPSQAIPQTPATPPRKRTGEPGIAPPDGGPAFGFDPALYDL